MRNLPIYLLLLVGLALFIYFILYRPYSIHQDKKRFEKAEVSLNELYDKIVATVGKPDQEKRDKSCAYASRVFEKGPLRCGTTISLLYENIGFEVSNKRMNAIAGIVTGSLHPGVGTRNQSGFISAEGNKQQSYGQDYEQYDSISCSVTYSYPEYPSSASSTFQTSHQENLKISSSCGGQARAEHYPVK